MPSFDIVSRFDMQELDNAVNSVKRDIQGRYDFKGSSSSIELSKSDNYIIINGDTEYQINSIVDMLQNRSIGRKVSIKTFDYMDIEEASGMKVRQKINLKSGMSKEYSKKINTTIKELKLKVNSQIQGESLRVTGKKIDDLQFIIEKLKKSNIDLPLQFINFK